MALRAVKCGDRRTKQGAPRPLVQDRSAPSHLRSKTTRGWASCFPTSREAAPSSSSAGRLSGSTVGSSLTARSPCPLPSIHNAVEGGVACADYGLAAIEHEVLPLAAEGERLADPHAIGFVLLLKCRLRDDAGEAHPSRGRPEHILIAVRGLSGHATSPSVFLHQMTQSCK